MKAKRQKITSISVFVGIGIACLLVMLVACSSKEKKMAKGFVLPLGDNEKGKQAFIELKCHRCHTVAGELMPENVEPSMAKFHLGGEVYRVKTYGQLVSSVIHPNHNLSKDYLAGMDKEQREGAQSPMPSMVGKMTVQQMIDIVSFLNSHYVKLEPEYEVPYYGP
ncbi:MAG: cytochrome c [Akkermansiaceae bacterium]|nr:cytochrome c [Akkermansiaceae bacterium]